MNSILLLCAYLSPEIGESDAMSFQAASSLDQRHSLLFADPHLQVSLTVQEVKNGYDYSHCCSNQVPLRDHLNLILTYLQKVPEYGGQLP